MFSCEAQGKCLFAQSARINFQCPVNETTWGRGTGASKKDAETAAAADALRYGDESGAFNAL